MGPFNYIFLVTRIQKGKKKMAVKKTGETKKAPKPADIKPVEPKETKKKVCKFCGASADKIVKEFKTVKLYGSDNKIIRPEKGKKFECWVKTCTACDNIIGFGNPKLVDK